MANTYTPGVEPYGYQEAGIFKRVSWGALFAGLVVAIELELLLGLLGVGIGLGVINPATSENPAAGIGIGAGIWLGISTLIALFIGGWTTAKLAGSVRGLNGVLHSIVMWGLVTLVSFFLMTSTIGSLIGGVTSVVGKSLSVVAKGASSVVPQAGQKIQQETQQRGISVDSLMNEAKQILGQGNQGKKSAGGAGAGAGGGAAGGQDVQQELRQSLENVFSSGGNVSPGDRENLVNILVTRTNMSRPDAERTVNKWIEQYQQTAQTAQQTKQQALQTTENAMNTLSKAALWLFVLLLLEAGAAALGGWLGSSRREIRAV